VIEEFADSPPCGLECSFFGFAQERFELGKDLLNRVEVWAIGREEEEPGAPVSNRLANRLSFVAAKVVHDDDVAWPEGWRQHLAHIGREPFPVDRPVQHEGGVDPVVAQRRDEGHGPPVAVGGLRDQRLSPCAPAMGTDHVGLGPGLVNENEPGGINLSLVFLPSGALAGHVRAILFDGEHGFFYS